MIALRDTSAKDVAVTRIHTPTQDECARRILLLIGREGQDGATKSYLLQGLRPYIKAKQMQDKLDDLVSKGIVKAEKTQGTKTQRSAVYYRLSTV